MVHASTLVKVRKVIPHIKFIFYSEIVFTTKSYNVNPKELPSLGAKKVYFIEKAYDQKFHRPVHLNEIEKEIYGSDVSFIGTYEFDRHQKLLYLAKSGINVRVWGNGWAKSIGQHPNLHVENRPAYGEEYVKHICTAKINLCFLRKIYRDLQTDRSIEIPACGGLMIAERTPEHEVLFKEEEAVFLISMILWNSWKKCDIIWNMRMNAKLFQKRVEIDVLKAITVTMKD